MTRTLSCLCLVATPVLLGAPGCKSKKQDVKPKGEVVEIEGEEEGFEVEEKDTGAKLRPSAKDFEKLFAPPPCPDPTSPDPLGGSFTLEQALEGLEKPEGAGNPKAVIKTTRGTITCELYADKTPRTVANFIGLARGVRDFWNTHTCQWVRKPFYDGLIFHRVIPEFMIQGGCPLKNGTGNPGYTFDDEIVTELHNDQVGILSMANAGKTPEGKGTNGSQFFILDKWSDEQGPPTRLDGKHTVFGICTPADIVFQIARTPSTGCVEDPATGKCGPGSNRPLEDVVIEGVSITY